MPTHPTTPNYFTRFTGTHHHPLHRSGNARAFETESAAHTDTDSMPPDDEKLEDDGGITRCVGCWSAVSPSYSRAAPLPPDRKV